MQNRAPPTALGRALAPNLFDLAALALVSGVLVMIAYGAHQTNVSLTVLDATPISLDPWRLPEYALRTTLRMLAAIVASLVFTFIYATLAAKSRRAEMVLIPILDILQSVPILGFLTFTVVFFMNLFPGRVIGAELASVFAIFTSQAWNMTFSMYQSLRNVPKDLEEATQSFHLSWWRRFWRLDVPFAMPGLVWNTMMSMSGGWFFVVASEAITVGDTTITLPGVGAYVATAIKAQNFRRLDMPFWPCWPSSSSTISCCSVRLSPGPTNSGSNRQPRLNRRHPGCSIFSARQDSCAPWRPVFPGQSNRPRAFACHCPIFQNSRFN